MQLKRFRYFNFFLPSFLLELFFLSLYHFLIVIFPLPLTQRPFELDGNIASAKDNSLGEEDEATLQMKTGKKVYFYDFYSSLQHPGIQRRKRS